MNKTSYNIINNLKFNKLFFKSFNKNRVFINIVLLNKVFRYNFYFNSSNYNKHNYYIFNQIINKINIFNKNFIVNTRTANTKNNNKLFFISNLVFDILYMFNNVISKDNYFKSFYRNSLWKNRFYNLNENCFIKPNISVGSINTVKTIFKIFFCRYKLLRHFNFMYCNILLTKCNLIFFCILYKIIFNR